MFTIITVTVYNRSIPTRIYIVLVNLLIKTQQCKVLLFDIARISEYVAYSRRHLSISCLVYTIGVA